VTGQRRYQMVVLDLDGTLLLPDGSLTPRTIRAVANVAKAGFRLCIATGRNHTESRPALDKLGIKAECVFVGGAMVIDTNTGKTLHRTTMHPQVAADACRILESLGHAAMALQDTCETGLDYLISRDLPIRPASKRWMAAMKMGIEYAPNLGDFHHRHTLRVGICAESAEMEPIMPVLQKHFGDRAMMHRLRVPGVNCEVLEVFDPAVSKWEGISFVIRRHKIDARHVIAVGDDMNDLHMIQHSGLGVAMGNARPELKAAANRVIGKNTEDGLAQFLEELLDGKLEA
jgi:Cof subfamily protein (haloacid dehalogenase superfamily)